MADTRMSHWGLDLGTSPSHTAKNDPIGTPELSQNSNRSEKVHLWQTGPVALSDLVRPDAAAMIHELETLGVQTVMVTGDAPATAHSLAGAVGITAPVHAGVLPEDNFRLVKTLQASGQVVGMCGDGANDAALACCGTVCPAVTQSLAQVASLDTSREGSRDQSFTVRTLTLARFAFGISPVPALQPIVHT